MSQCIGLSGRRFGRLERERPMRGVRWESDLGTETARRGRARDLEERARRVGVPLEYLIWDNVAGCAIRLETAERWGKARAANGRKKAGAVR